MSRGEPFGNVEAAKFVGPLEAPVSGVVRARNAQVLSRPGVLNEDPNASWLVELDMADSSELLLLLTGEEPAPGMVRRRDRALQAAGGGRRMSIVAAETPGLKLRKERFGNDDGVLRSGSEALADDRVAATRSTTGFLPISVTGTACALQCDHCKTHVLEGMVTLQKDTDLFATAQRLQASGTEGHAGFGRVQPHRRCAAPASRERNASRAG